jgi:GGDEF domain-containing protein
LFNARLNDALAKANGGDARALLCLDLDGFKDVNDRLGHAAGDALLKEIAGQLLKCVRKDDTAALSGTHLLAGFGEARIGVSIGIACGPEHAASADALMLLADKALYAAKHSGLGIPRLHDDHLAHFTAGIAARGLGKPERSRPRSGHGAASPGRHARQ